uniref:G-protein coupled receptors family 1 profile domain-containing protein n=1 Tax=Strongyloides venezuelensis TaxID=75913 RepID=A0A0K0FIZ5_STRVS
MIDIVNNIIFTINIICGTIFNFIAIYVTIKKSKSKNGEGHLSIMFIVFITGIITSIIHGILRIQIFILNDTMIFIIEMLSEELFNFKRNKLLITFSIYFSYFTMTLPTSIIISRYIAICKNIQLSFFKNFIIVLFSGIFVLIIGHGMWTILNELPNDLIIKWVSRNKTLSNTLTANTFGIGSNITFRNWHVMFIELPIYFLVNYTIVIVLFIKYKRYMNTLNDIMSERTKKMNKDFMFILILQSFAPILVTSVPNLIFLTMLILGISSGVEVLGTNVLQLLNFTPTVNALLFLLLPLSNRKYIKKIFKYIYLNAKGRKIQPIIASIGKQLKSGN